MPPCNNVLYYLISYFVSGFQGETNSKWRTDDFYLFKGGSLWRPPPINPFQGGLSDSDSEEEIAKPTEVTQRVPEKIRKELKDE